MDIDWISFGLGALAATIVILLIIYAPDFLGDLFDSW